MKLTHLIRLAALRTLMRFAGFVLRRFVMPGLRPATAATRPRGPASQAPHGQIIDGESRRIDTRHNERW